MSAKPKNKGGRLPKTLEQRRAERLAVEARLNRHDVQSIRDQLDQQGKISDFALMLGILDTALGFMHRNWHRIRIENPTDDGQ